MGSGLTKVPAEKVALAHCDQTVTAKAARSNFVSPPFKIQNKVAVCTVPFCDILYLPRVMVFRGGFRDPVSPHSTLERVPGDLSCPGTVSPARRRIAD